MQIKTYGSFTTSPGRATPLGATYLPHGVQFAVFSRHATSISVLLYLAAEDSEPIQEFVFDPRLNKTGDIWHILIHEARPGMFYLLRVDGPFEPKKGHRFNKHKLLLDPYTKALTGSFRWDFTKSLGYDAMSPERDLSFSEDFDAAVFPKCIIVDDDDFDWEGDRPLEIPLRKTIIYEAHLRNLSAHPSSGVEHPGTYRGVIEMIPYLKSLGITAIEFLPIQEFDEFEYAERLNPLTGDSLRNHWGYSTIAFFAPKAGFAADGKNGHQINEFKEMVRELHRFGIEVILDIVFNHTGEGNEMGYTQSFKGLDNSVYYMLDANPRYYMNFSGCGNTMNCNHPVVRNFILDCLRYWVLDMHVDGFRFDLGSILGRDSQGNVMPNPPTLIGISEDPVLRNTKIIAEAWDAGGAYQVGNFPGGRWAEWNDRFRDDVRRFWRGDPGMTAALSTRFSGSSDLYADDGRKPYHSINFVTCHDGFTVNDLVTYNEKHNFLNGENNGDGNPNNLSYNYGVEGETRDQEILEMRTRQVKNFFGTVLLSIGTPMILGGDEFRRTQFGNNNAYCQDNEISWFDYRLLEKHADILRFFQILVAFRNKHPVLSRRDFFTGVDMSRNSVADVTWLDEYGKPAIWDRPEGLLALRLDGDRQEFGGQKDDDDFYLAFNATLYDQYFTIPAAGRNHNWYLAMDTSLPAPRDIREPGTEQSLNTHEPYLVQSRSMVLLLAKDS